MNGTQKITIDTVKQNVAFKNIKAFLDCNAVTFSEKMIGEYLSDIARMATTYHKKYGLSLDDIIAEAFFAFAIRFRDYPNTLNYQVYDKQNVCKYIRRHIIKYCETEIKTEVLERNKIKRCIKYNIKA